MDYDLAKLSEDQEKMIDDLEQKLGVVLIAYDGYQQESSEGKPAQA